METSYSTAILASDFSSSMADHNRNSWKPGALRHLSKVLNGSPVIITTDSRTGHTVIGAVLGGVRKAPGSGSFQVEVNGVWHNDFTLGEAIIPLTADTAKWDALRSFREESSAAVQRFHTDHPELSWGKCRTTAFVYDIDVTYEPHLGNPAYADRAGVRTHERYSLGSL